ncbi:50S ribosomal protein L32e [archaeon]|jgi:ribosomal protein L32E|nr:50S ribosomal protein L32e [archaeon]MBT7128918.1 50S ribosomal protein L32e [archaeon]
MVEEKKKTTIARKKPKFLRTDWHKKIRLGRGVKKNQKWHGAKGRQNKFRLGRKGRGQRPKVGWGAENDTKGFVGGVETVRVENLRELEAVKKNQGVIVGRVGARKRISILEKAKEMGLRILNRYKEKNDAVS